MVPGLFAVAAVPAFFGAFFWWGHHIVRKRKQPRWTLMEDPNRPGVMVHRLPAHTRLIDPTGNRCEYRLLVGHRFVPAMFFLAAGGALLGAFGIVPGHIAVMILLAFFAIGGFTLIGVSLLSFSGNDTPLEAYPEWLREERREEREARDAKLRLSGENRIPKARRE